MRILRVIELQSAQFCFTRIESGYSLPNVVANGPPWVAGRGVSKIVSCPPLLRLFDTKRKFMKLLHFVIFTLSLGQRPPRNNTVTTSAPADVTTTIDVTTAINTRTIATISTAADSTIPITTTSVLDLESIPTARATLVPSSAQNNSSSSPAAMIVGLSVAGGAVLLAIVGILLFRKFSLAPSSEFKNRLYTEDAQLHRKPSPFAAPPPTQQQPQYAIYENTEPYYQQQQQY